MKYQVGDKFEVIDRKHSHSFDIGEKVEYVEKGLNEDTGLFQNINDKKQYCYLTDVKPLNNKDMQLTIDKDRVLAAAAQCPDARKTLETLFPEAFEDKNDINKLAHFLDGPNTISFSLYERIPGCGKYGKAQWIIDQIKKAN